MDLNQLKTFLWKSADILRGKVDSADYSKYIFGLLFYKRMSDVWQEEFEKALEEFHDEEIAKADYNHRFQIPEDARWEIIEKTATDIGVKLNKIFEKITNANSPKLDKIFDDLDFANSDRFPNETLQRLINHFSKHKFGENYYSSDVLGDAYEYLIQQFASGAGKKGGEFYSPREVERVIMQILKPHPKDHILDPTVGSGGFLLEAYQYLRNTEGEQKARSLYLYGQEINLSTFAIAKINMFLHGLDGADIRRGDTLADPQFTTPAGTLKTFDIVVANFPYSIKEYPYEKFRNDRYGRCAGYDSPPPKNADYAFILHIIKSLNENGRAGIVIPHGVLFRGGAEGRIREQIIKNDLIEAVIALPPKLFFGVSIPVAVLILNKNKPAERKDKMIIINAEKEFEEGKKQNRLRNADIEKIRQAVANFQSAEKYAEVVTVEQVAKNDYNLNISRYVDISHREEKIDLENVWKKLDELKNTKLELDQKVHSLILEGSIESDRALRTVKLGEIAEIVSGSTPKTSNDSFWNGEILWATPLDLSKLSTRYISDTSRRITQDGLKNCSVKMLPPDSLIMSSRAPIGYLAISKKAMTTNQGCKSFVFDGSVDVEYMYYYLLYNVDQIKRLGAGSTFAEVGRTQLSNLVVKLPPLSRQKHIATILSALDDDIENTNQTQTELAIAKKGLLQKLLGEKVGI
jgi:type I restriction enzyme M protein